MEGYDHANNHGYFINESNPRNADDEHWIALQDRKQQYNVNGD